MRLDDARPGDIVTWGGAPLFVTEITKAAAYVVPLTVEEDEIRTKSGKVARVKRRGQMTAISPDTTVELCDRITADQEKAAAKLRKEHHGKGRTQRQAIRREEQEG